MADPSPDDLLSLFGRALDEFERRVSVVTTEQWSAPTPCAEWDVRALVSHLVSEQLWAPAMLGGETMEQVGTRFDGEVLGDDPVGAWCSAAARSRAAAESPDALRGTVHASYGDVSAEHYLGEMTLDSTVHAWDLARAIGADEHLDQDLVALGLQFVEPNVELLADSGMFAPPVPVPPDSSPQVRLLGLLGRRA
jgi:uncharacterized protein (TIGR03086 family)